MSSSSNLNKARAHFEKKEYKNALLMYYQAQSDAQSKTEEAIIWAEISWVYYYQQDYQKAIEAAENVLVADPDYGASEDVYRIQGYCYLAMRNAELAEKMLNLALEAGGSEDKQRIVKFELGKLHFVNGHYDLAYPFMMEIMPQFKAVNKEYYYSVLFYLGFINYYLKNTSKAQALFEEIMSSAAGNERKASALFGLAFVSFRNHDYLKTISLCEDIVEKDSEFFDRESLAFLTGASYFYLGRKDIFDKYHQQILEAYPNSRYESDLERLAASEPPQRKQEDN